jgi:hypothetical protein
MKYKVLMLAAAFLIILSSFANAQLAIGDVYSTVNGKKEVLSENEKIFVTLDSTFSVQVRFKNDYTTEEDVEVDINIRGKIDDIDDGDAIDRSDDINLDSEEYGTLILSFKIPQVTDSDDYYFDFEIDAEDENGVNYRIDRRHKIEVKKSEDEVRIQNLKLGKSIIQCDASIQVSFDILNTGAKDEDDLKYTIENEDLDMHLTEIDWFIEEGEIMNIDEVISVNKDAPPGEYEIVVNAYCNEDKSSIRKTIKVTKESCGETNQRPETQQSSQQTEVQSTTQTQPSTGTTTVVSGQNIVRSYEGSKQTSTESPMKRILIINGSIILIGVVIYLLISSIMKKK